MYASEEVDSLALEAEADVGANGGGDADVGVAEEFLDDDEFDAPFHHQLGSNCQASPGIGHPGLPESCSEFLYWFKGVSLTRAAARRRPVTAARSCLPPRWRRPPTTRRAEPGS
jgi:hypothetical protein